VTSSHAVFEAAIGWNQRIW